MAGADIRAIARLLGDSDMLRGARYQDLSPEFLAAAVGRLDGVFGLESPPAVLQLPEAIEAEAVSA